MIVKGTHFQHSRLARYIYIYIYIFINEELRAFLK